MNGRPGRMIAVLGGLAAAAIALAACGGSSSGGSAGSAGGGSSTKVAVLAPGTDNDGSWGQAVTIGAKAAAERTRAKLSIGDNLNDPSQYQQQGAAYASQGYNLVVIANGSDPDVAVKLAKQFPNVQFCEAAVTIDNMPPNLCTYNPIFQNGDFLAGALGAMVSKTGHVGVIGGFDFPVLDSEMEGFILGARYINPNIKVSETFINTWTDVATARAAAAAQIAAGADVLFSATDQATQGMYAAARAHPGTYVIPQYFDSHSQAPDVILTSVLLNLQGTTQQIIEKGVHKKLSSTNYVFGLKDGVGQLAPYYNMAPSVVTPADQKRIDLIKGMIQSGQLKVPFLGKEGQGSQYNLSQLPPAPAA
jgi:basic membrane protein A